MENIILETKELTKYYDQFLALDHLNLQLYKGEIFGFIGPNGAGKSTTIRTIMHLISKNSGQFFFKGKEFLADDLSSKAKIGYLPSEIHLYEDLKIKDMLDYHESFFKKDIHSRRIQLTQRLKLDETRKIEELSLGNLKKLGIILALMHEPELLILDEPTSGLDPIMQQTFYEILQEEKKKGTTIFYSTHILNEVSRLCDRVGIIKDGKLLKIETIEDIRHKNLKYVSITSPEIEKIIKDFQIRDKAKRNTIRFKNELSASQLISKLSSYSIDDLLIEEASIEDIFLHYYTEEKHHV